MISKSPAKTFLGLAYQSSKDAIENLVRNGSREHALRQGPRNRKLSKREKQDHRTRLKVRPRVEHIFVVQAQRAENLILRSIGIIRSGAKIGSLKLS